MIEAMKIESEVVRYRGGDLDAWDCRAGLVTAAALISDRDKTNDPPTSTSMP